MKRVLLGAILLILSHIAQAQRQIFLYADSNNRQEFVDAFAAEPMCNGITLAIDHADLRIAVRVHYMGSFAGHLYGGFMVDPTKGTDLDFGGRTVETAVRTACFVIKGKGGKLEQ
jgi:hypothetical protein